MSQAGSFVQNGAGPIPPQVPTTFVTDVNSPAIPVLNILNVFGGQSSDNTDSGIQTDGSSGGDVLTIQNTNRLTGTVTTANATPTKTNCQSRLNDKIPFINVAINVACGPGNLSVPIA